MGITRLSRIPVWHDSAADPDAAVPIGGVNAVDVVTLTKVFITDQMAIEFGDEQAGFQLWRTRPLEVRTDDTPIRKAVRLSTIEISTGDRKRRGHTAVMGYRPTSFDWFGWSRFKLVSKSSPKRHLEALLEAASGAPFSPEAALWAALSAMTNDPFGNEDRLYARFRQLERTDSLPDPAGYYDESDRQSVLGTKANRAVRDPEITLGICEDFDACRDLLRASEVVQNALEAAKDGHGTHHDGTPLDLSKTAVSLARELMEAAIVQALSGPGTRSLAPLQRDKAAAKFGTVAILATWLFEDSVRNLHKRTDYEERVYLQAIPEIERGDSMLQPETRSMTREDVRARIQRAFESLRSGSYPITSQIWGPIMKILSLELEQFVMPGKQSQFRVSVENACVYCAALERFLPLPDNVIEILEELRRNYPLFVEAVLSRKVDGQF